MKDLYDLTLTEAAEAAIETIMEHRECSKKEATILFKNALVYNVVIEQIVIQADFLAGDPQYL